VKEKRDALDGIKIRQTARHGVWPNDDANA
jgi:hypothetical protein